MQGLEATGWDPYFRPETRCQALTLLILALLSTLSAMFIRYVHNKDGLVRQAAELVTIRRKTVAAARLPRQFLYLDCHSFMDENGNIRH